MGLTVTAQMAVVVCMMLLTSVRLPEWGAGGEGLLFPACTAPPLTLTRLLLAERFFGLTDTGRIFNNPGIVFSKPRAIVRFCLTGKDKEPPLQRGQGFCSTERTHSDT